jgi:hypothetical protein
MTQTLHEQPEQPPKPAGEKGRPPNLAALQDGLRAKTYPLPHETEAAAQRAKEWQSYYGPTSPAAKHLVNECARATVVADRSEKFRAARIEQQKANVKRNWRRRRKRKVDSGFKRMSEDMLDALQELESFSDGCAALAKDVRTTIHILEVQGHLPDSFLETAIYHHGIWPVATMLHLNATAYTFHTLNLACTPGVTPEQLDAWIEPENRPWELEGLSRDQLIPGDAAQCRQRLLEYLKLKHEEFALAEVRLRQEEDEPELRRLHDEAETLDEKAARKVIRSHAESRTTFHRAFRDLCKTLERDAEEGRESTEDNDISDWRESDESNDKSAPPDASAPVSPVAEPADRGKSKLPNDPEIASEASSQTVEAKEDSTTDGGSAAGVPPSAVSVSRPQQVGLGTPGLPGGVLLFLLAFLAGQLLLGPGWERDAGLMERARASPHSAVVPLSLRFGAGLQTWRWGRPQVSRPPRRVPPGLEYGAVGMH